MPKTGARQRLLLRDAGFLRQAGQRVVLAEDGDHRAVLAGLAHHRGRDTGDVTGDPKSFRLQHGGVFGAGAELGVAKFRHFPDAVGQTDEIVLVVVHVAPDFLGVLHFLLPLFVPEAGDQMIVHHPGRLHERIAYRGADKTEAGLLQRLAHGVGDLCRRRHLRAVGPAVADRFVVHERPEIAVQAAVLGDGRERGAGIVACRKDLQPVADQRRVRTAVFPVRRRSSRRRVRCRNHG